MLLSAHWVRFRDLHPIKRYHEEKSQPKRIEDWIQGDIDITDIFINK